MEQLASVNEPIFLLQSTRALVSGLAGVELRVEEVDCKRLYQRRFVPIPVKAPRLADRENFG
jgi:hypothetical protein